MRYIFLLLTLALITGCNSNSTGTNASTYTSAPLTIGTGTANTWIKTDASNKLTTVGVTISDGALTSLGNTDSMFELPMPAGVSTIFKSIALDYATHDPAPYNHPHIDPHFFLYDMNSRMSIIDGTDSMPPMNMMMPSGFMCLGVSEAMMGVHWMDTTASEYHGIPFQCTFDYGTSMGNLEFFEVMCDKASLEGHKIVSNSIRKPTMMNGMTMSIPSSYSITYDGTAHTSTIELDGF
jgi:hypothetical protein